MKRRLLNETVQQPKASLHIATSNTLTMVEPRSKERKFEELAVPELASLYNHARWLTRNDEEAEDLVQETLTKALRGFDSFRSGTNFRAWIFRIQKNTFLTTRTALSFTHMESLDDQPDSDYLAANQPSPELEMIQLNNAELLHSALEELPVPLREVILLCDIEEFKYREIAEILSVPIGTVMSRLSRARHALRILLTPHLGGRYER